MRRSAFSIALALVCSSTAAGAQAAEYFTLVGDGPRDPRVGALAGKTTITAQPIALAAGPAGTFAYSSAEQVHWVTAGRITRIEPAPAVSDLAFTADGSLLVAESSTFDLDRSVVWRYPPDAARVRVAGRVGRQGGSGDGGPARAALLRCPSGLDVDADGGILIADPCDSRVRRVSPNGTITTIAGTGDDRFDGDGGPAAGAGVPAPFDVAVLPRGGFALLDREDTDELEFPRISRLRIVDAAGVIRTLRRVAASGLSAQRDGSLLLVDDGAGWMGKTTWVRRVAPDGALSVVLDRTDRAGIAAPLPVVDDPWTDGPDQVDAAVALADGGMLVAADFAVRYAAPMTPSTLAVALLPATRTPRRATRVSLRTTRPANVRVDVWKRGRIVAGREAPVPAGDTVIALPALRPGLYEVRVQAEDGAQIATTRAEALLGGQLPLAFGRRFVRDRADRFGGVVARRDARLRCEQQGRRRVRCAVRRAGRCRGVAVVRLRADGAVDPDWHGRPMRAACRRDGLGSRRPGSRR